MRAGSDWALKHEHIGSGLVGKTLGVIGLGNIGREIVRIASVMDCDIIGHDPYAPPVEGPIERVELDELMSRSDYIIIQCALTAETRGMIDAGRLALMKPTAYLVNTSRGPVVDEPALARALADGGIAGAALDVYEREPDVTPELLDLENIVLVPHLGSATHEAREAMGMLCVEALRRVLS